MMEDLMKINEIYIESNKYWREHAKFYNEFVKFVDLIPLSLMQDVFDTMTPHLISQMKSGSNALK